MNATDVMVESRALLNDTSAQLYTDTVLLPYLKKAWLELQNKYIALGIPYPKKIGTPITVAAGALTLTLPADFILPIQLKEKAPGDLYYTPMRQLQWEPDDVQQTFLGLWAWHTGAINFRGATTERQVKPYYYASFAVISSGSTTIPADDAKSALAARTAALAAEFIGGNIERANSLNSDGFANFDMLAVTKVKQQQGMVTRRRGYKSSSRMRRSWVGVR